MEPLDVRNLVIYETPPRFNWQAVFGCMVTGGVGDDEMRGCASML